MHPETFNSLKRFSPSEFEHPDMIDHLVLILLDDMVVQETILQPGLRFIVHSDVRIGDDGDHGSGTGIDGHLEVDGRVLPSGQQFLMAARYQWTAIGFYPYWNRPGIHVARRRLKVFERRKFWWRDGLGNYRGIEEYFL